MALLSGALILLTLAASLLGLPQLIKDVLFAVAMGIAAYPIASDGLNNLIVNRDFNINLLMTIAAVGALVIGDTLEAATVIFLFAIGEALEGYTSDRARDSLRGLVALAPAQAIRISDSGGEVVVPVSELKIGDTILVKPGERIAMDGLVSEAEAQGQTTMLLCDGDRVRGFIAVADSVRADSKAVIGELNALGLTTVMLTGDNAAVAESVGREVGVNDVRAGLMPAEKVDAVQELAQQGDVAMVGDGVNDTPALAAATVGIAMGGAGSAQALETADVALMADDLSQLPFAVRLARLGRRLIGQNIVFSLGTKLIFVGLALTGNASMWMAVAADMGVSLLVTLNGMRPLRFERE